MTVSDHQQAIDKLDQLDAPDDYLTDSIIAVYSGIEAEDSGGYDGLVTRRGAPEARELLMEIGWAEPAAEMREEELPLTETGAAIHHYYHEIGKENAESEKQLNEQPEEFAKQAFDWWYQNDNGTGNN